MHILKDKEAKVGADNLNNYIRYEYLRAIDTRWQEHLENLEALREAVYLRAYSQKNPLLEYKLEGFAIFDKLIIDIKTSVAQKIVKVQIQESPRGPRDRQAEALGQASHMELGQFAGNAGGGARPSGQGSATATAPRQSAPQAAQVQRSYPKVGRNDPCPCGSGKKYKFCHGQ